MNEYLSKRKKLIAESLRKYFVLYTGIVAFGNTAKL